MTATTLERHPQTTAAVAPVVVAAPREAAPAPVLRGSRGSHVRLFAVPFRSPMSTRDSRRLAAVAGLDCDLFPKLPGTTVSPGLRRLDFASGLFLVRGGRDGEWWLEGRTWGSPAPCVVHRWHVWAATAARVLDPDVWVPPPSVMAQ